jgi:hypothetical protein
LFSGEQLVQLLVADRVIDHDSFLSPIESSITTSSIRSYLTMSMEPTPFRVRGERDDVALGAMPEVVGART